MKPMETSEQLLYYKVNLLDLLKKVDYAHMPNVWFNFISLLNQYVRADAIHLFHFHTDERGIEQLGSSREYAFNAEELQTMRVHLNSNPPCLDVQNRYFIFNVEVEGRLT
ncbi:MAG: hypothetical protein ACRCWQ_03975, partial [Bacilli bacterium]